MVVMNFDEIDEASSFDPIPEGWYVCTLSEIEVRQTKAGDEMWGLKWEIVEGEYEGRFIWDNLVFTPKVYGRVKLLFTRCGVVPAGDFEPVPAMIEGKTVKVYTEINEYTDDNGKAKKNNKVTFDGYDYADSTAPDETAHERTAVAESDGDDDDDAPF